MAAFWKGNATNVVRIFPYSAAQLMANDQYKRLLAGEAGQLSVPQRLAAGALAGMTASAITHPLDTVRLRLSLPGNEYRGKPPVAFFPAVGVVHYDAVLLEVGCRCALL